MIGINLPSGCAATFVRSLFGRWCRTSAAHGALYVDVPVLDLAQVATTESKATKCYTRNLTIVPYTFATTQIGRNSGSCSISTSASPALLDSVNYTYLESIPLQLCGGINHYFICFGFLPHLEAQKKSCWDVATPRQILFWSQHD
jgi:hypothetical protein